jgi:nicotinamidase/pyrazinamidase
MTHGTERGSDPMTRALLVIDVQNDFCPGGALPVPAGDRVVPVLNRLIEDFEASRSPVYASRDWHPPDTSHFREFGGPWPPHCIAGTPGADLHPALRLPPDAVLVSTGQGRDDDGYSAFEGTTKGGARLDEDLWKRGIEELYVGGLATDYCVRATVLDARRAGFRVTVITDAIAGIGEDTTRRALEEMKEAGARLAASSSIVSWPVDADRGPDRGARPR